MKQALIKILGRSAFFVLGLADRFISRSHSGLSPEESTRDPYKQFSILRERGQILRSYTNRGWLVLGFEPVQQVFRDPRFGSDIRKNRFLSTIIRAAANGRKVTFLDNPTMLNLDPPDHTRLRKLVSQGFIHKSIQALAPGIEVIVDQCLSTNEDHFDIIAQLAKPLPAIVIAELLGLPEADLPKFQALSEALLGLTVIDDEQRMTEGTIASEELTEYFRALIEVKRENPGQDLIGALIAAEEEGDRLTSEEMYSTCVLLLVAGHETTTRLIGNGMYSLLQNPEQFERLRADESLVPNAIEEMLRFEPPVQLMPRFAREDMVFHGQKIKKNQLVLPVIASANRDPQANHDPDKFDITRDDIKHVAFGHGIHLCLGMSLARLEAKIAITALLKKFPAMKLASDHVEWTGRGIVRGMDNLVVTTGE